MMIIVGQHGLQVALGKLRQNEQGDAMPMTGSTCNRSKCAPPQGHWREHG